MKRVPSPCRTHLRFTNGGFGTYNPRIEFVIRQSKPADRDVIAAFNVALALETEDLRLDPAIVRAGVEGLLRDAARGIYFVAENQGAVIGQVLITYEWSDWRNGNFWWLQSVYVQREFRARGVFGSLFAHVLAQAAAQKNVCGLRLYMERENHRAREVYRRLGLNETRYQVFERVFPS
ncbi:MAG: GNAT family N-acetyltransferase [Verrucomicrobiota bacterium]